MKPEPYDKYYNKQFIREMDERDTSFEDIIAELATNAHEHGGSGKDSKKITNIEIDIKLKNVRVRDIGKGI